MHCIEQVINLCVKKYQDKKFADPSLEAHKRDGLLTQAFTV